MQIQRDKQSKGSGAVKAIAFLLALGGVSFCLALLWQNATKITAQVGYNQTGEVAEEAAPAREPLDFTPQPAAEAPPDEAEESAAGGAEALPEEPDESSEAGEAEGEADEGEDVDAPGGDNRPDPAPEAVPLSPRVSNSYFDDAIFFGDSLSVGIPLYQVAGNPDTVAFTGINPLSINTSQVINTPQGKVTLLEAAKQYGPKKKVYIMLGGNGLWMDEKSFVEGYQTFLDGVKAQYPGAQIFLQSILPVTVDAHLTYETADNDVIRGFNKLIIGLAKKNGVYYLDVAQALMDEDGRLPKEASPLDGMHLTPEYYEKWFDYLRTHTVEEKK